MDMMFAAVLIASALVLAAGFTTLLAFRVGAPLLLIFLCLGLLVGEDGLGIAFNDPPLAFFVGSLALAVILFDSGFGTNISSLRTAAAPALTLATMGVLLTAGLVGAGAHLVFGMPWLESFLIGAIISSTDAAAVFFLLRVGGINIRERARATLEIESGSNDPMAIFLTVAIIELLLQKPGSTNLLLNFVLQMGLGLAIGLLGGFVIVKAINSVRLEPGLYPILVLAGSLAVFGATGVVGGSGFLAVYVAGIYAGNRPMIMKLALRRFQDGLTWFAQISMFLLLGLLATPSQFPAVAIPAIGLALFLTFVARPLAVWLCLLPFRFKPDETAFISWVGLRGAVSILLAILPLAQGLPNGQYFFNVTFIVVITSLVLQGWTIRPLAKRLGLVVPPSLGPLEKIELELPGGAHHELVVYRVATDSPVAKGAKVPRWARPSLVVRDGHSTSYQFSGKLRAGDQVYLFVSPRYIRLIDRLFASPATIREDDADFFGDFVVDPGKTLEDLGKSYQIERYGEKPETEIATFIEQRLGGVADVGDRIACGSVELVVRELNADGSIKSVGVALSSAKTMSARIPLFLNARELGAWVRRRMKAKER
ncbi:MAG: potassium/proton antiporter [Beijerinckiaceae bacterium]|nr:potassium/proton antiporter [Beijerinckiaceae bacterium]